MRFFHDGTELHPPVTKDASGRSMILAPPRFWRPDHTGQPAPTYVPCEPGSVCFSFGDHFYRVPPGGFVDIPEPVDPKDVLAVASHLRAEIKAPVMESAAPLSTPSKHASALSPIVHDAPSLPGMTEDKPKKNTK